MTDDDTEFAGGPELAKATKEPTLAADAVAWGLDADEGGLHRLRWRGRLRWVNVAVLVCVSAVALGLSVYVFLHRHPAAAHAPAAPASTVVDIHKLSDAPPAPPLPPKAKPLALTMTRDDQFIAKILADKLPFGDDTAGHAEAVESARSVCDDLVGTGQTVTRYAGNLFDHISGAEGWTRDQTLTFVTDAANAYCPAVPQ